MSRSLLWIGQGREGESLVWTRVCIRRSCACFSRGVGHVDDMVDRLRVRALFSSRAAYVPCPSGRGNGGRVYSRSGYCFSALLMPPTSYQACYFNVNSKTCCPLEAKLGVFGFFVGIGDGIISCFIILHVVEFIFYFLFHHTPCSRIQILFLISSYSM